MIIAFSFLYTYIYMYFFMFIHYKIKNRLHTDQNKAAIAQTISICRFVIILTYQYAKTKQLPYSQIVIMLIIDTSPSQILLSLKPLRVSEPCNNFFFFISNNWKPIVPFFYEFSIILVQIIFIKSV